MGRPPPAQTRSATAPSASRSQRRPSGTSARSRTAAPPSDPGTPCSTQGPTGGGASSSATGPGYAGEAVSRHHQCCRYRNTAPERSTARRRSSPATMPVPTMERGSQTQLPLMLAGSGGRIRTSDLQVMSLTSFLAAPPRDCCMHYRPQPPCRQVNAGRRGSRCVHIALNLETALREGLDEPHSRTATRGSWARHVARVTRLAGRLRDWPGSPARLLSASCSSARCGRAPRP
jgi:hypothetical protein